ncbi:hypothetical protein C8Q76DRAFT_216262 [Earliella scabrosa]|nr:hypothetical protein C8Q76DRAFT_216262 [Earliella scabrosa]
MLYTACKVREASCSLNPRSPSSDHLRGCPTPSQSSVTTEMQTPSRVLDPRYCPPFVWGRAVCCCA